VEGFAFTKLKNVDMFTDLEFFFSFLFLHPYTFLHSVYIHWLWFGRVYKFFIFWGSPVILVLHNYYYSLRGSLFCACSARFGFRDKKIFAIILPWTHLLLPWEISSFFFA